MARLLFSTSGLLLPGIDGLRPREAMADEKRHKSKRVCTVSKYRLYSLAFGLAALFPHLLEFPSPSLLWKWHRTRNWLNYNSRAFCEVGRRIFFHSLLGRHFNRISGRNDKQQRTLFTGQPGFHSALMEGELGSGGPSLFLAQQNQALWLGWPDMYFPVQWCGDMTTLKL